MIREGAIVLFESRTTEGVPDKIRPAVLVRPVPGPHNDWLLAMISTRLHQAVAGFDMVLFSTDDDFPMTGLKTSSVVRAGRLAIVNSRHLLGRIGDLSSHRRTQLQQVIAAWILGTSGSLR